MQPSIMFECDEIHATYVRMTANGVEFLDEPKSMKWGTFAQFVGSAGYVHFLKAKRKARISSCDR